MANTEKEQITRLQGAFTQIEEATTVSGTAATAISARLASFAQMVKDNPDSSADLTTAADKAITDAANLKKLADALTAMGKDPGDPVPIDPNIP